MKREQQRHNGKDSKGFAFPERQENYLRMKEISRRRDNYLYKEKIKLNKGTSITMSNNPNNNGASNHLKAPAPAGSMNGFPPREQQQQETESPTRHNASLTIAGAVGNLRRTLANEHVQRMMHSNASNTAVASSPGRPTGAAHAAVQQDLIYSMNETMYRTRIAQVRADQPLARTLSTQGYSTIPVATPLSNSNASAALAQQCLSLERYYLWNQAASLHGQQRAPLFFPAYCTLPTTSPAPTMTINLNQSIAQGGTQQITMNDIHAISSSSSAVPPSDTQILSPPTSNRAAPYLLPSTDRYLHPDASTSPSNPHLQPNEAALEHQARSFDGHMTFPMTLHRALAELELVPGGTDIAAFMPDGRSFQIRNRSLLEREVLPVFFPKMTTFGSFQRQLNLYDFTRIPKQGVHQEAYYRHDLFIREYPALSSQMKRNKIKGGGVRGKKISDVLGASVSSLQEDDGNEEGASTSLSTVLKSEAVAEDDKPKSAAAAVTATIRVLPEETENGTTKATDADSLIAFSSKSIADTPKDGGGDGDGVSASVEVEVNSRSNEGITDSAATSGE